MYQKDFPVLPKNIHGCLNVTHIRISIFFWEKRGIILNATAAEIDGNSFSTMEDGQQSNLLALPMQRKSTKTIKEFVPTEEQINIVLGKEMARHGLTLA
jgi:hypothetical protein